MGVVWSILSGQTGVCQPNISLFLKKRGSGALSGKMLLVRIVENNKIDAYFRAGRVK